MSNEWIGKLKPGDKVIIQQAYMDDRLATVKRTTKTLIITDGERHFRKRNGLEQGGLLPSVSYLVEATDEAALEIKEAQKRNALINRCRAIPCNCLTNEQLLAILKIADGDQQ